MNHVHAVSNLNDQIECCVFLGFACRFLCDILYLHLEDASYKEENNVICHVHAHVHCFTV